MYGHDLLGGPPAYPNFGKSLDDIAGRSASRELAMALERTPTPNPFFLAVRRATRITSLRVVWIRSELLHKLKWAECVK